jgi:hypothetical protein
MQMSVYEQLQKRIVDDVQALQLLKKRRWLVWPMERVVKEEDIGRCCYLAEEWLAPTELQALKTRVGMNEKQWRRYKARLSAQ